MSQALLNRKYPEVFPEASWTVIILINGENDLLPQAEQAYNRLANIGSCLGDVNFVVIFDGLSINEDLGIMHRPGKPDKSYPNVYYVTKYRYLTTTAEPYMSFKQFENLAKPDALSSILQEIKARFPAKRFGFIYKGHGGAGRTDITSTIFRVDKVRKYTGETNKELNERLRERGGKDWELEDNSFFELNEDSDILMVIYTMESPDGYQELTYARMRDELKNAGYETDRKLSFICLDCCWGQIMENVEIFQDISDYLIASADEMPVLGIGYEEFAEFLVRNRNIRPDEIAKGIVAVFFKNNYNDYLSSPKWEHMGVSLTCTNLSKYNQVAEQLRALVDFARRHINALFLVISMARHVCREYTNDLKPSDYAMYNIDMIWFLDNLRYFNQLIGKDKKSLFQTELADLINALYINLYGDFLSGHMTSNYDDHDLGQPHIGGKGVAITFPINEPQFNNSLYGVPDNTGLKIPEWEGFLRTFVEVKKHSGRGTQSQKIQRYAEGLAAFYELSIPEAAALAKSYLEQLAIPPDPKWRKRRLSTKKQAKKTR